MDAVIACRRRSIRRCSAILAALGVTAGVYRRRPAILAALGITAGVYRHRFCDILRILGLPTVKDAILAPDTDFSAHADAP